MTTMTNAEHYQEAERLLELVAEYPPDGHQRAQAMATAALAHATLAGVRLP